MAHLMGRILRAALRKAVGDPAPGHPAAGDILGNTTPGTQVSPPFSQERALSEYRYWVYAATNAIARDVSKAQPRVYEPRGGTRDRNNWREVESHPLVTLIDRPNEDLTFEDLLFRTSLFCDLCGNAYWYMPRNALGLPAEIWDLEPQRVRVVAGKEQMVAGYLYEDAQGVQIPFEPDEVMHIKTPNPQSRYYGMAPLEAMWLTVGENKEMRQYGFSTFQNQAVPGTVFYTEGVVDEEVFKRIKEQYEQIHRGASKTGKTLFLDGGYRPIRLGMTAQESSFIEGRTLTRDEILAFYGVPKQKVGIGEAVNRATAEELERGFQRSTVGPRLSMIESKIRQKICSMYRSKVWFEFERVVPEDIELRIKQDESDLANHVRSVNEIRVDRGLSPVPWGDVPLAPIGIGPLILDGGPATVRTASDSASAGKDHSR